MNTRISICLQSCVLPFAVGMALILLSAFADMAKGAEARHVLVLHSYHSGMSWVENIEKAIQETLLVPPFDDVILHVEYMDTKRNHTEEYYAKLKELLREKYKDQPFSLILSSDNNAFDFLLNNRDSLFPNVPVVFCGVNDFEDSALDDVNGFTGVAEIMSSRDTVRSILQLYPDTKEIFVINDYLKTGRAWQMTIARNLVEFRSRVRIAYNDNLSIQELRDKIQSLKPGTVVLLGVYFSDRDGSYLTYEKLGTMLTHDSPVPVFCLLRFNLRDGVIGGKVISGYHQGKMMSEVARRVLSGEQADDIPVAKVGANAFIFDWQGMEKEGVDIALLPSESIVINRPVSFYQQHYKLVWTTITVFAVLCVFIFLLTRNVIVLRAVRKKLTHSESKYRSIFDNATEGLFQTTQDGRLIAANQAYAAMFLYRSPEEALASLQDVEKDLYVDSADRETFLAFMAASGRVSNFTTKMKCKGGEEIWVNINARASHDVDGNVFYEGSLVDITKAYRADRMLKRFRFALDNSGDALFLIDHGTLNFIDVNTAACALLGYGRKELLSLTPFAIKSPDAQKTIGDVMGGLTTANDAVVLETEYRRKDGTLFPGEVVLKRMRVDTEDVIVASVRDVTERKQFEDSLVHAKEQAEEANRAMQLNMLHLRTLIESLPELVWLKDPEGVYVFCNKRFERFFGASEAEIIGKTDYDFVDKELADFFRSKDLLTMKSGRPSVNEESVVYADDGHREELETIKTPIYDKEGRITGVLGVARDITERKMADEQLRDSELRHRVIFENSPLGMIRFSSDGVILDCNDNFVDLMGSSREELIGFHSSRKSAPKMREALKKALAGETASFEDYYTSVTGGKTSFLHVEFNPVNLGQSPTEVIATLEDVAERKKTQDDLRAAKEQAERFSKSKTEFLTNMSHEIRTPLNGILGILQLMQTTGLNNEQAEYVAAAMRSSKRLTTLLTDILDLSRVEAGKLVVQQRPFDLPESLEQICDLYNLISEQTGVELRCKIDASLPQVVLGDPIRLQQVLTNLVGNAYKFTTEGHIAIEACALPVGGPDHCRVLFTVSDTGSGIPDDQLDTLFDAFTQVSEGYTREHQGAGLGLAICKRLVDLMGGNLTIESEEGVGTTLYISIPFALSLDIPEEPLAVADVPAQPLRAFKILLAEDERVNSLVTSRLLEKAGHAVSVVENGRQAVETLQGEEFDVVLMDIQMPVMDGVEAAQAIRNGDAGDDRMATPIVAVTAYAMVGDGEKFLEAGMDGYVVKPIELNKLTVVLNDLLGEG